MKVFSKLTADTKKHKCTSLILKLNLEKSNENARMHENIIGTTKIAVGNDRLSVET